LTVGIGVLCDDGQTVVLASDMRVTYGKHKDALQHERAGKQYGVPPFNFAISIAGSPSSTHAIVSQLSDNLKHLLRAWQAQRIERPRARLAFENIRNAIESARKRELRRLQACAFETDLGTSVNDWLTGKLPSGLPFTEYAMQQGRRVLQNVKEEMKGKVGLIVAGFLREEPIFFRAIGAEPIEEAAVPEVHVIGGEGAVEARRVLSEREQGVGMGLARTLVHVHEAMKAARKDRGVGDPNGYYVIRPHTVPRPNGMLRCHPEHPTIVGWAKKYALSTTSSLDSRFANDLALAALYVNQARRYDWLGDRKLMLEL